MDWQRVVHITLCFLTGLATAQGAVPAIPAETEAFASQLGWVRDADDYYYCGGYYQEPELHFPASETILPQDAPIDVVADQGTLAQRQVTTLQGHVILRQQKRELRGDKTLLYRDPDTGRMTRAEVIGHIQFRQPGMVLLGDRAKVDLTTQKSSVRNTLYRLTLDQSRNQHLVVMTPEGKVSVVRSLGNNAWGTASKIAQVAPNIYDVHHGTYTTCAPSRHPFWQIRTNRLHFDRGSGRGTMRHGVLYVAGVPTFYWPYMNFPIDRRRKTGFLFPDVAMRHKGGVTIGMPFYWDLAPNYDMTLTPRVYQKRGAQLTGSFRYLQGDNHFWEGGHGSITATLLPNDSAFNHFRRDAAQDYAPLAATSPAVSDNLSRLQSENDHRYFVSAEDFRRYNEHWSSRLQYSRVSDDYYLQDFGSNPFVTTKNQLLQKFDVDYESEHWYWQGLLQRYQTLHPLNQIAVSEQYERMPNITGVGHYDLPLGVQFTVLADYVNFMSKRNPGVLLPPVEGQRGTLIPTFTRPFLWGMAGEITPSVSLQRTSYRLTNPGIDPSKPGSTLFDNEPERFVPIASVTAGLNFERDFHLSSHQYRQTLEPRLFYLYSPYRNQRDIPIFDTTLQPFDINQLFRQNRFSGYDRVSNANQVAWSVTSRILDDDSGAERMKAVLGQIAYFEDRRVTLCRTVGCVDDGGDGTRPTDSLSPLTGAIIYALPHAWYGDVGLTWDPQTQLTNKGNISVRYQPEAQKILNASYTYLRGGDPFYRPVSSTSNRNDLERLDLSTYWPLGKRWQLLGRYDYNISHLHPQAYLLGLEYDTCCLGVRLVGSNTFIGFDEQQHKQYDHGVYLQFVFKGLANVGDTKTGQLLKTSIPGFVDTFSGIFR